MDIRPLDPADRGYALYAWREGFKQSPEANRMPWAYYKATYVKAFAQLLDDPATVLLGAYDGQLIGWLAMSPGKRVHTIHWVHVKHEVDGIRMRRRGVMTTLLEAAGARPGRAFVYTMHARRDRTKLPDGSTTKSLDESLVAALRERGVTATYVSLKEWLR